MNTKRLLVVFVAVMLVLAGFIGCQKDSTTAGDEPKADATKEATSQETAKPDEEPEAEMEQLAEVTLKFYFPGDKPSETDTVWEYIEEQTKEALNAKFSINFVPWNDYNDKIQLLIASSDDYDSNFDGSWVTYNQRVNKEAYLDIAEMAKEYMPGYYKILDEQGFINATMIDGALYCVPWTPVANNKPFFSWDESVLNIAYAEPVTTMEEMDAFLQTAHESNPEKVFVIDNSVELTPTGWLLYSKYEYADWFFHGLTYDLNDSTVQIVPIEQTEMFKEIIDWNTKWVNDGIVPKDAMVNRDKYSNLSPELRLGGLSRLEEVYKEKNMNNESLKYAELYPGNKYIARSQVDNVMAININAANPERTLMFFDLHSTNQEVYDAVMYGIEGLTYQIDNGIYKFPEGITQSTSNYMDWSGQWGLMRTYFIRPSGDFTTESWEYINDFSGADNIVVSPIAAFFPDTEPIKNEIARRDAIYQEFALPLLFGLVEDTDKAIEEYIEKQKEAGLDTITAEIQKQIDAYLGN